MTKALMHSSGLSEYTTVRFSMAYKNIFFIPKLLHNFLYAKSLISTHVKISQLAGIQQTSRQQVVFARLVTTC